MAELTPLHPDLFPYQREGARWLASMKNALLADSMGLGKSASSIAACDIVSAKKILVLCPGVARINWQREFERWQTIKRSIGVILSRNDSTQADVVISSYEMTSNRQVLIALLSYDWDVIIVDEMQRYKSPRSLSAKILYSAHFDGSKGLVSKADRVWLLSGTPFPNGPHEMWTHTRALFPKAIKGLERYQDWVDHFCYTSEGTWGQKIFGAKNIDDFVDRLAPYVKRRHAEDVLKELPELRFGHVVVQPSSLPPRLVETEETEQVVKAALAKTSLSPDVDDLKALEMIQSAHLSSLAKWTGIAKAPAVAELIKNDLESGMEKVVVFARHKEVFATLEAAMPGAMSISGATPQNKRQAIIDAFQKTDAKSGLRVLICHIDIASTALTLTAAHNVVFAETTWVPKDVLQAAKRCHRIGQTKPVLARIVSLKGSLDEAISDTIVRKYKSVSQIEAQFVG